MFIQPKRRSLFGDASKDITKSLAKKFDSGSSTLGRRPVEDNSLKRSSSIRTTDKPRSSFYTPTPESTSTIPERTMTLGRASSFRVNNRTPASSTAASAVPAVVATSDKKSSSSGYTTSLMNWRPFRKSRDETSDSGGSSSRKTSLTGGGSSISATLGRSGTANSSSRTTPLSSNTLGASNSSLKRSTSSVASTLPNKSAHSSSTNVQLLPTQRTSTVPSTSNFLSRSNSVRTPSAAAPARTSVKGTLAEHTF